MKNNRTTFLLVGALFLSTFVTVALLFFYNRSMRTLAEVDFKSRQVLGNGQALLQSLGNESLEYSKKNPDITPVLQNVGWVAKPAAAPAAAPKPTTK